MRHALRGGNSLGDADSNEDDNDTRSKCVDRLLEKLTVPQLFEKFATFQGTRRFITAFTRSRHLSLSWARSIQSIPPPSSNFPKIFFRLFPFPVPSFVTLPHCLGSTTGSVEARGKCILLITRPVFMEKNCYHIAQPPSWRTTPRRLSATAYSIWLQLPSILEAVPPSATWGRAMPWWQGPTYHGLCLLYGSQLNWRLCELVSGECTWSVRWPIFTDEIRDLHVTQSGQYNGQASVRNKKKCGFCVGLEGYAVFWQVQKLWKQKWGSRGIPRRVNKWNPSSSPRDSNPRQDVNYRLAKGYRTLGYNSLLFTGLLACADVLAAESRPKSN